MLNILLNNKGTIKLTLIGNVPTHLSQKNLLTAIGGE